jgi:hypothetical protein
MIGHSKIVADLKKLHENGQLGHGYVFTGPAMVGKKLAALSFANFLENGEFVALEDGKILSDVMLIGPGENGSIGIDTVREIKNFLWQKPNASSRRTLIINDADFLTTEAQNALLKVTEEPPVSSLLILVTADEDAVLSTITSRLPKVYFGSVPEKEIEAWLVESVAGQDADAKEVIKKAKTTATAKTTKKKTEAKTALAGLSLAEAARRAMGKPGLAWRLLYDADFQKQLALAEQLLKTPAAGRRDLIKKIIEPDEFSFRKFLDAVIMNLAWVEKKSGRKLWHKALALYGRETDFSLNPRLQLEALLS